MKMSLENSLKKYEYVKNALKQKILKGEIKEKLPGERELAKQFKISYMTIRKAIEKLADEEIVYKEPSIGTFVCKKGFIYKKTHNIGFFLPHWIGGGITGYYYSALFTQIENFAHMYGYNIVYFSKIESIFPYADRRKVDGLIFAYFPEEERYLKEISPFVHIVTVENALENSGIPAILIDNFDGGYQAAKYLINLGHRNIAYITGRFNNKLAFDRYNGFMAALKEHKIKIPEEYIIKGDFLFDTGFKLAETILSLKPSPTAVVTGNDEMALGLIKGLNLLGKKVPDDISVVGFDDIENSRQFHPALTTIHVPHDIVAKLAVEYLLNLIDNKATNEKSTFTPVKVVPVHLVERESCKRL
jgi:LacI family transcriptional regulator